MKKRASVLPDTNTILRYLMNDVPEQSQESGDFFEQVRVGQVEAEILESVVVEAVYILTKYYSVPKDKAAEALQGIMRYKGISNSDREQLLEALGIFASSGLDIVDCLLAVKAKGRELFTFDKKLRNLNRKISHL
jgi:predicted nucleic-acid-binding protein